MALPRSAPYNVASQQVTYGTNLSEMEDVTQFLPKYANAGALSTFFQLPVFVTRNLLNRFLLGPTIVKCHLGTVRRRWTEHHRWIRLHWRLGRHRAWLRSLACRQHTKSSWRRMRQTAPIKNAATRPDLVSRLCMSQQVTTKQISVAIEFNSFRHVFTYHTFIKLCCSTPVFLNHFWVKDPFENLKKAMDPSLPR